jgi:hypothetical protein
VYFLDRIREGVWRLEVYPDAVPIDDPFKPQRRDKVVTRAIYRAWPMRIDLRDLGASFSVDAIAEGNRESSQAEGGRFTVRPGVYILSALGPVDRAKLPPRIGHLGLSEFHGPKPDALPLRVEPIATPQHVNRGAVQIGARVVADSRPDSVILWMRPLGAGWYHRYPMESVGAYEYRASIPADSLAAGSYKYVVSVRSGNFTSTFPEGVRGAPWDWDFHTDRSWTTQVVTPDAPLRLLTPAADASRLAFTRIGDGGRAGIFDIVPSAASGEPALRLTLPVNSAGSSPEDYTTSLVIDDLIRSRGESATQASGVRVKLRGVGPRQRLHLTLMEKDGTSWAAVLPLDSIWIERTIPLSEFRIAKGVKLPLGFPGQWNYWVEPAAGRGGAGDSVRARDIERLQFSLRREDGVKVDPGKYGVEVESVTLLFR